MPSSKLLHELRYFTDVRLRVGEALGDEVPTLTKDELALIDRATEAGIPADVCADQIIVSRSPRATVAA